MIPRKYGPQLFSLLLSGLMSMLVSGIATFRASGADIVLRKPVGQFVACSVALCVSSRAAGHPGCAEGRSTSHDKEMMDVLAA